MYRGTTFLGSLAQSTQALVEGIQELGNPFFILRLQCIM